MGEMTRAEVIEVLSLNNPGAKKETVIMYADAYQDYQEAARNIQEQGALVAHPKTGGPLENPYLKIRTAMAASLQKLRLDTSGLWND